MFAPSSLAHSAFAFDLACSAFAAASPLPDVNAEEALPSANAAARVLRLMGASLVETVLFVPGSPSPFVVVAILPADAASSPAWRWFGRSLWAPGSVWSWSRGRSMLRVVVPCRQFA